MKRKREDSSMSESRITGDGLEGLREIREERKG